MARIDGIQGDQRKRITDTYEAFLHSMALLRGDRLSSEQVSRIVGEAVAGASHDELRSSVPPASAIGRLQQLLVQTVEAGRPRNLYGAEAARAAPSSSGTDGVRVAGFGSIEALRAASSARFRELSSDSGTKGSSASSGSGLTGTGSVTAEFARSFAGTGLSGGTLKTFAEVGLDRGTFNAFRREGFSQAQITDNARDVKAMGWQGKDDLSIAQHASTDVRKAAVATEQAKTAERREQCLKRERELEQRNEARPDSDPQKQHDRRFFERRRQDHVRHSVKAGVGSEARQHDSSLPSARDTAGKAVRQGQDGTMAKEAKKQAASVRAATLAGFEVEPDAPKAAAPETPTKPVPVRMAATKPAAPVVG